MKPGQRLTLWWQQFASGGLRTPQALMSAVRRENPDKIEDRFTSTPVDEERWTTPARLAKPNFCLSSSYSSQQQRADWQQTDRRLRLLAARVIIRARGLDIPLYVHSAFRTSSEQKRLMERGVTKTLKSAHTIGEAFDLVHGVYHWDLTEREWLYIHWLVQDELRKLNATLKAADKLALNWGGNDGTSADTFKWDPAHWEILDYRKRLRSLAPALPVHMSPQVTILNLR